MILKKGLFIIFIVLNIALFGQEDVGVLDVQELDEKKLLRSARDYYEYGDFKSAKRAYLSLLKINPSSPIYNFELGRSFFESPYEKMEALRFLKESLKYSGKDTIPDIHYYLGRANHLKNNFKKAISHYNIYIDIIKKNYPHLVKRDAIKLIDEVNRYIEMCNYGLELVAKPVKVAIIRLDDKVNSPVYPDYAPVISANEEILVFTSRREGSTGGLIDQTGEYYEDVYLSKKIDWEWTKPIKFDSENALKEIPEISTFSKAVQIDIPLNTDGHDAVLALSADGQKLFLYRKENVYVSELKGTKWTTPTRLSSKINVTKGRQPSLSVSPDGNTFYFVSNNIKDSYGGQDIYKSVKLPNGEWSDAINLGPKINTPDDEDSPYLHPDGKTLYFSSKGHRSMGGYDIFKSIRSDEGVWSDAINLGYPVNTSGDDTHFVVNAKGNHAYYASVREINGILQSMDIYMLLFEGVSVPVTQIKGLVTAGDERRPIAAAINIVDKDDNPIMAVTSNSSTGAYSLVLPPNKKYVLTVSADGFVPYSTEIFVPDQKSFYQLYQEINLSALYSQEVKVGQQVTIQNAFFDIKDIIDSDSTLYKNLLAKVKLENESDAVTKNQLEVQGFILGADQLKPINADITITNKAGKTTQVVTSAENTGAFSLVLPSNDSYEIRIAADGYLPYTQNVDVPNIEKFCLIIQDFQLGHKNKKLKLPEQKIDVNKALNCDSNYYSVLSDEELIMKRYEDKKSLNESLYSAFFDQLNEDEKLAEKVYSSEAFLVHKDEVDFTKKVEINSLDPNDSSLTGIPSSKLISSLDDSIININVDTILFQSESYQLDKEAKETLNQTVVAVLKKYNSVNLELVARTDSRGSKDYNLTLSKKRSKEILTYLNFKGIDKSRILTKNLGEENAIAPNENPDGSDNPEGRRLNRSVTMVLSFPRNNHDISLTDINSLLGRDALSKNVADNLDISSTQRIGFYQEFFSYNVKEVNVTDPKFLEMINKTINKIKSGAKVIIQIESSASTVPTKEYKTNTILAALRGEEAKKMIINLLKEQGIKESNIVVNPINSFVSGPSYSRDYQRTEKYKKYQYVKITIM